jgi:hypothetical protein
MLVLKERRAWRSISDPLLMDFAVVLDDKKMRRCVKRMRVACGEREREVPAVAMSNVFHLVAVNFSICASRSRLGVELVLASSTDQHTPQW